MHVLDPTIVLAPYLEPAVRGRRVVVFGDASGTLGSGLLERGARLVHVYDPDAVRAAEFAARRGPSRTLVIAPMPSGDLAVRDGAFEVAVVPDLSQFAAPDDVIARARRLVAPTGLAVFASPNQDARTVVSSRTAVLSYYELFDAVSLQFPDVRMLGQAPFAGYVIADFAPDGEPEVVVDTSLLERGAEEPGWFIALGSRGRQRLDGYSVIQVPQTLVREEAQDSTRIAQAEAVSQTLQARSDHLASQLGPMQREVEQARARIAELEAQAVSASRVTTLETELEQRADQLKKMEARAGDTHVRASQLENKVRDLEEELRHQRDRAFRLSNELEEEKKRSTKAALELGMIRRTSELPIKPEAPRPEDQARIATLEEALEATHKRISSLERELDRALAQEAALQKRIEELEDAVEDHLAIDKQAGRRLVALEATLREKEQRIAALDATVLELGLAPPRVEIDQASRRELAQAVKERDAAKVSVDALRQEHEAEVFTYEKQLVQLGRTLAEAKSEIARREDIVRELLLLLEEARGGNQGGGTLGGGAPGSSAGGLQGQAQELAARCARKEAELQEANWRVQALESRLGEAAQHETSHEVRELEAALFAAHQELDVLRTSLRQEHASREALESRAGEALAQAQAQLQHQAVLLASATTNSASSASAG